MRARLLTPELLELPEKVAQLAAEVRSLAAQVNSLAAEVKSFIEATNQRFDRLEQRVQSLQDDVGILKGAHARSAALGEAISIAREMGLQRTRNLAKDDLWTLTDRADTLGIPANELRSFRNADLIMEAIGSDGTTCYIAVEISFTVNGRDTRCVLRNAEFLTRFTGQQAYPVVAGLYRDDRIQDSIESGAVFWYQLDPEVLEAE